MMTAPVIVANMDAIVLALTPLERLKATGSRLGANFETDSWFILATLVVIGILIVMFLVVSYSQMMQQRRAGNHLFTDYSRKSGLSRYESEILLKVAQEAGLNRSEAVFTMADAFNRGAAKIIEESLAKQPIEESERLRLKTELSSLREKLGFQKRSPTAIGSPEKLRKLSSRQIPVGKKLYITRRKTRSLSDIESTVVKNDDVEFAVRLATRVETMPGEFWCAHYYFGASVWEFDTSVVGSSEDTLVLSHSDDVRFINRRRFLRVPVNRPAFVARFPFAKTLPNGDGIKVGFRAEPRSANAAGSSWGLPEFVPAVVTELAGPGLRIEVPLEVKTGERILVVFKLNGKGGQDSSSQKADKTAPVRIVEDVCEVRHVKAVESGFSIAVELTGLSDSDVSELIRATNAASLAARAENQDVPGSSGNGQKSEEAVPELVAVRGV
jgi:hypothetical protein